MASIYDQIRATLEVELSNVSDIPDIAYENVPYKPTTGQSFVVPKFVPVTRRPAVRGLNPQHRYEGVFRVFCYVPEDSGPSAADGLANKVIDAFESTTDLTFDGVTVSIDYAERGVGFTEKPFYYVPVNIGWYIYA